MQRCTAYGVSMCPSVNLTQQLPKPCRFKNGRMMFCLWGCQYAACCSYRIAVCDALLNRKPENLAHHIAHPLGRFMVSERFFTLQTTDHHRRCDGVNWLAP